MKPKRDWLWDRKITVNKARFVLKNPDNARFLPLAALLLSRKNTPKEVFRHYIKPVNFIENWNRIKRQMRKDKWNNPRIEFWQAIYEAVKEKYKKNGINLNKEPFVIKEQDAFCKIIADQIKSSRKKRGLTQSALAAKLKVSQQIIARIESGKENISLGTLKKITDALGAEVGINIE